MEVEFVDARSSKVVVRLDNLNPKCTVGEVKSMIAKKESRLKVERQQIKFDPKGKALEDNEVLQSLKLSSQGGRLYIRDLGPQIGWTTVFLIEYSGPLFLYPLFYIRPTLIYGRSAIGAPIDQVVHIALACWTLHYAKRLFETVFIHRFSHGTMPLRNLFKNCSYYWGFAAFISYFINHPLYMSPAFGKVQLYAGLSCFLIGELGNFCIHKALRDLRPAGTKDRRVPMPTSNPFTALFKYVSCPNYTYEMLSWIGFSVMTQSLPALLFTIAGAYQMSVWAIGKHRNYRKEFGAAYPKRKAIIPFVL